MHIHSTNEYREGSNCAKFKYKLDLRSKILVKHYLKLGLASSRLRDFVVTNDPNGGFASTIPDKLSFIWGFILGDGCIQRRSICFEGTCREEIQYMRDICEHIKAFLAQHNLAMTTNMHQRPAEGKDKTVWVCGISGPNFPVLLRDFSAFHLFGFANLQHSKYFELIEYCGNGSKIWEYDEAGRCMRLGIQFPSKFRIKLLSEPMKLLQNPSSTLLNSLS